MSTVTTSVNVPSLTVPASVSSRITWNDGGGRGPAHDLHLPQHDDGARREVRDLHLNVVRGGIRHNRLPHREAVDGDEIQIALPDPRITEVRAAGIHRGDEIRLRQGRRPDPGHEVVLERGVRRPRRPAVERRRAVAVRRPDAGDERLRREQCLPQLDVPADADPVPPAVAHLQQVRAVHPVADEDPGHPVDALLLLLLRLGEVAVDAGSPTGGCRTRRRRPRGPGPPRSTASRRSRSRCSPRGTVPACTSSGAAAPGTGRSPNRRSAPYPAPATAGSPRRGPSRPSGSRRPAVHRARTGGRPGRPCGEPPLCVRSCTRISKRLLSSARSVSAPPAVHSACASASGSIS